MIGRIFIYGYGNLGFQLLEQCKIRGIRIEGIFSNHQSGDQFFKKEEALTRVHADDVIFICTKDSEIQNVLDTLNKTGAFLISCSGSFKASNFKNHGVWYPLYSFSKSNSVDWDKVPVFIEYDLENTELKQVLYEFSNLLGITSIKFLNSKNREELHLLAVFANNFTNACLWATEIIMENNPELELDFLLPIINQTISKIQHAKPSLNQTGPALRKDETTINRHLKILEEYKDEQQLYLAITNFILKKKNSININSIVNPNS